jgi:hypothetical protein
MPTVDQASDSLAGHGAARARSETPPARAMIWTLAGADEGVPTCRSGQRPHSMSSQPTTATAEADDGSFRPTTRSRSLGQGTSRFAKKADVTSVFVESLANAFDIALRLMAAALSECPDDLWQMDLWPDEAPTGPTPHGGLHGSAPWFLGYHALTCLDYDLTGDFEQWAPPQPFDDNTYGFPNRAFTRPELLGYVAWCRVRVGQAVNALTEESAVRLLPSTHRYAGTAFGMIVGTIPGHVIEHAAQIRQFLAASGVKVSPMPGDRRYSPDT